MWHAKSRCCVVGMCVAALAIAATPAHADDDYSPWRAFGLDEIRLGAAVPNLEGREGGPGYNFKPEGGVEANVELLLRSPWPQFSNTLIDFMLRPRPMLGATISTHGDTSLVYLGAAWSVSLFDIFFLEATFGGAYHDGPLTAQSPNFHASYGCRLNFHESGSVGVELGSHWRLMATIEHMSNGHLCDPNSGLTTLGGRLGYKF